MYIKIENTALKWFSWLLLASGANLKWKNQDQCLRFLSMDRGWAGMDNQLIDHVTGKLRDWTQADWIVK